MFSQQYLYGVFIFLSLVMKVNSYLEFTNVKCEALDKEFCGFDYCILKAVNRSYKYVSLKVKLFRTPVTKVKLNLGLYKRLNGYKPFLYNLTIDACKFLKFPKSNPVVTFFYEFFKDFSNINHTCPYDHDLVLEKMSYSSVYNHFTTKLPFPEGSYMLEMHWIAYDIKRAITKFYWSLS
ncbi:uncharacterized protein [Drosophila suzukii]|uniref:MD-2-related lipid-recognition domain-containing protein n=1 Tax=Drosophila suzukii TaxID=28584 RepID=A0AB40A6F9_DROSZ|nr:uncharacterized protein LOC108020024 [Drosophila suzukii]